ncbi:hypothetical protein QA635_07965 [Bradyrhizobium brasilense]|uniref:hypothetical protein n=1 Tax=Bradyrhizobium brasilense TaxID=1419277 RepID=UPI0024B25E6D|nr:hypothetical protein [Bradyrhizobium australafricanum]WFU34351.1 hypothetical protein QA635_07965 [Bradyrhizobium australafricanum]
MPPGAILATLRLDIVAFHCTEQARDQDRAGRSDRTTVDNGTTLHFDDILSEPKLPVIAMVIDAKASSRCVQSRQPDQAPVGRQDRAEPQHA